MLDHLSEGRFEFGIGRGSSTTEQRGFGIEDPELTREMVAEILPEIVRMWRETHTPSTGSASRCLTATCFRSRTPTRTRRCG